MATCVSPEAEVTYMIKRHHPDFATLRRVLIGNRLTTRAGTTCTGESTTTVAGTFGYYNLMIILISFIKIRHVSG
ncbi:DUF2087 domain-containing protein [Alicyclobacillus fastidiosus]|uniref:DUF2087 domain-containing protein n=1 Tax=Alicyclobacillus fastidiosus TaxID=392011 RepID=UPI0034DD8F90